MKFFLDTANLAQIREACEMGVLDGVTTNPSLMAKENIRGEEACRRHYVEICNLVKGDVSAEVIATDFDGMVREGTELAALHPQIVVKLPCTADGIRAVKYFAQRGVRTNCTLVFSVGQALLAAKAGATYVSPFVGRLDDISEDGIGSSDAWTTFRRTASGWWHTSCGSTVPTASARRCSPRRSAIRTTSSSASMPGRMSPPARSRRSRGC